MVIDRFARALVENSCRVHGPLGVDTVAATVVALALEHAGAAPVAIPADDPMLAALDLGARLADAGGRVLRSDDPAWAAELPSAAVGVTGALIAVAETGTVALAAAPGMPRATSLLPPVHVCVVDVGVVVETLEAALARVAEKRLPSALTWISGPSRTGDLEMRITLGVHGPKVVEIVLVGGSALANGG
jgi:L-lactate dehydrogenase complex protein LldG